MHVACHHADHVYMYGENNEVKDFQVKFISQTKVSIRQRLNT